MTALVDIGGGHRLAPAPAASWLRAVAAGCPATITSSYRDPVEQQRLRTLYLAGKWDAYVAPVEKSEHVTGQALDLKDPAIAWVRLHPDYGFVFTDPSERWHVAYRLVLDRHLTDTITPPRAADPKEDDMPRRIIFARLKTDPKVYRGDCLTRTWVPSQAAMSDIESMIREGVLDPESFEPFEGGHVKLHRVDSLDWLGKEV